MAEWLRIGMVIVVLLVGGYGLHYLLNSTKVCTPFRTQDGYLDATCIRHWNSTAHSVMLTERGAFIDNPVEWKAIRNHNDRLTETRRKAKTN